MRKVLGLVGATLLLTGPALAADLLKAPAMPLAPVLNWTGWYIGATAGYSWADGGIDNIVTSSSCNTSLAGCRSIDHPPANVALATAIPAHFNTDPKGFIGGAEIGYNYQLGQFVLGVEADFSGADIKGSDAQALSVVSPPTAIVNVAGSAAEKLDFLATIRARLGFLLTPSLLAYGTAGGAFGHVSTTTTFAESVGGTCFCGPFPTVSTGTTNTLGGFVAGGGLEWMIAPQWSLKGEYLYYNFGTLSTSSLIAQTNGAGEPFFSAGVASNAFIKGSIARAGVNFHF